MFCLDVAAWLRRYFLGVALALRARINDGTNRSVVAKPWVHVEKAWDTPKQREYAEAKGKGRTLLDRFQKRRQGTLPQTIGIIPLRQFA